MDKSVEEKKNGKEVEQIRIGFKWMQINVSGEIFMRIILLGFYALQKGNLSVRANSDFEKNEIRSKDCQL